ncbi:hypothetical protein KO481_18760 [Nocardia sp. NEAU-G5]|uniref:RNA polymerase sigma-70 region 4 domain-containing protein n=1 Tax=Nocardia albiluteola TaxID=2842303 RepID=A0ABS6B0A3_9NOCA|nr:sigma factor-like helix-turn-helix DNA-binding protein [Nocardia albiluteola]MBU3063563.1 hypothetical protein [Nocardia albiluteola]
MADEPFAADWRSLSWVEAFPWLQDVSGLFGEVWWTDSVADTGSDVRRLRAARIAQLAMIHRARSTILETFPGLPLDVNVDRLHLPARAASALRNQSCAHTGDLADFTIEEIRDWRNVGRGTVETILHVLADLSVPSGTHCQLTALTVGESTRTVQPAAWITTVMDDLARIADWYTTVGLADSSPLGEPLPAWAPDEILKARHRLDTLTADAIVDNREGGLTVAARIDDALRGLDQRAAYVLSTRFFAEEPSTLAQLGTMFDVSRERIRQIESRAHGTIVDLGVGDGPVGLVAQTVRNLINTVRPLADLLTLLPSLAETVNAVGQPVWRVLERLDDTYTIAGPWCVASTIDEAQSRTRAILHQHSNPHGVAPVGSIDFIETSQSAQLHDLRIAWLLYCGYAVHGDSVVTRTQSVGDYAAAILSIERKALGAQEIVDRFSVERNASTLRNAMAQDDRFVRVDRDSWALREWEMNAYNGIRGSIRDQIDSHDGQIALNELVEHLTNAFSVAESSVISIAASPPFETRSGLVRLMGSDREVYKTPARTRRLFRHPTAWRLRIRITEEHLRGSSFPAPIAIASIADLRFGETRSYSSPLGSQTVTWTGTQPAFGTIRRLLADRAIDVDTDGFLVLGDDGSFAFEPARSMTGDALTDAMSLIGASPTADRATALRVLAAAIGLPEESPVAGVIDGYRQRDDSDIADLLTNLRHVLETDILPQRQTRKTEIDEILDLL